jgi:hypothetical protein
MARMTSSVLLAAISRYARIRRVLTLAEWRRARSACRCRAGSARGRILRPGRARRATRLPPGLSGVFVLSIGLTAYTLGLRHAFDADHIAPSTTARAS